MKEDLLKLFGMSEETSQRPQRKLRCDGYVPRRVILRFKTDILDAVGNNYYVFWISGERRKRYATERDVFMLEDIQTSLEFYRHFNVIDVVDDGRMSRWLRGILHDKALGLID